MSEDGRAGGTIRISNSSFPVDVATVWSAAGAPLFLPVAQDYIQANVLGFDENDNPVGNYRLTLPREGDPALWNQNGLIRLMELGRGGTVFDGNAKTLVGQLGNPSAGDFIARASLWNADGTNPRIISGLEGVDSRCVGISDSGIYVGSSMSRDGLGTVRGFIGQNGSAQVVMYPNFNILRTTDISDEDWIIGGWTEDGIANRGYVARAFGNEIHDLGLLDGYKEVFPKAINDYGAIVGAGANFVTFTRALYWPAGATSPIDLNTLVDLPGETLVEAMDINNAGQILARGFNGYYIFTPTVPEPAGLLPCLVGLLLGRRRTVSRTHCT